VYQCPLCSTCIICMSPCSSTCTGVIISRRINMSIIGSRGCSRVSTSAVVLGGKVRRPRGGLAFAIPCRLGCGRAMECIDGCFRAPRVGITLRLGQWRTYQRLLQSTACRTVGIGLRSDRWRTQQRLLQSTACRTAAKLLWRTGFARGPLAKQCLPGLWIAPVPRKSQ